MRNIGDAFRLAVLCSATLAAYVALASQFSLSLIHADTVQQISIARNLQMGHGLSTSVVLYPGHYRFGQPPVPQVVWPPGLGVLGFVVGALEIDPAVGVFHIAVISIAVTGIVIFFTARIVAVDSGIALPFSLAWLVSYAGWEFAVRAMTEAPFILLLALSLYALARAMLTESRRHSLWWSCVSGCFAAAAITMRYAGVFFLPALFVGCFVGTVRYGWKRTIAVMSATFAVPGLVLVLLLGRNFAITGILSGGQFDPANPTPLGEVVKVLFWTIESGLAHQIGLEVTDSTRMLLLFIVGLVLLILAMGTVSCLRLVLKGSASEQRAGCSVVTAIITFAGVTLAVNFHSGLTSSSWFLTEERYFTVHWFAVLLATAICIGTLLKFRPFKKSVAFATIAACWIAFSLISIQQISANWGVWNTFPSKAVFDIVATGLQSCDTHGRSVVEHFRSEFPPSTALLTTRPHEVYLLTGIPTVGLTPSASISFDWDHERTLALADRMGASAILVFEKLKDFPILDKHSYLRGLSAGRNDQTLDLIAEVQGVRLFRILVPPARPR